jgi:predicted TPR repeat methyltransferase
MSITAIPSDPFTRRLQKIGQLISAGDLPSAAAELNLAVKEQAEDPRIYLLGMRLNEAKGEPERALQDARKAVSMNPMWVVSVTELSALLSRMGQHEEAVTQAKKAAAIEPNNIDMLTRVVDIAHAALKFDVALGWLRRLAELRPANAHYQSLIALDLRYTNEPEQALAVYNELLAANPYDLVALLGRAQVSHDQGDAATARADCETLVTINPTSTHFQFWHDLVHGVTPATLPIDMVREIHDGEATHYDTLKVTHGGYQLPRVMGALIKARFPTLEANVLDLGCGTGLLGASLGRLNGALVGVDVSIKMIERAAPRGVYDKFHTVNLLDALAATPDALYHVISACDVFPYVGDLTQAVPNAFRIVRPDGYFVFSCERAEESEADLLLRPSMRFAHKQSAVEALCKSAGFDEVDVLEAPLFAGTTGPLMGYIVLAHKAAE